MSLEGVIVNGQVQLDAPGPLTTGTRVQLGAVAAGSPEYEAHLDRVYAILARRFDDGEPSDVLATHNDHQP